LSPDRRRILWVGGALGLAALAFFALRPEPVPVDVGRVERGALRITVDEEGRTRVRQRYVLAAPAEGRLLRIALEEGDAVAEGDVVARLQPIPLDPRTRAASEARLAAARARRREADAQVAKARASLAQAQRDSARAEQLHAAGTLSPGAREQTTLGETSRLQELEAARSAAHAAEFELEAARAVLIAAGGEAAGDRAALDSCGDAATCLALRAPVAGRVLRVLEESERSVAPGTPLLEIGDPASLEIVVDVLSTDAVKVVPGATLLVEDWGGAASLVARVRRVEPSGFTKVSALGVEEQRVNVVADFENSTGGLGDGYRVEARIVVWQADDVLKAPTSALFRRGESWCVFVVQGGRARRRDVSVGQRGPFESEILAGLEPGEAVILHPSDQVDDGVRVRSL
jgi:HlyD family secretion protein